MTKSAISHCPRNRIEASRPRMGDKAPAVGLSGLARLQLVRMLLFLLCVVDVAASTLLFIRVGDGNPSDNIIAQVYHYSFGLSSFDVWLLALLRVCVFCGIVLAFCFNKVVALQRLKRLSPVCTITLVLLFCFLVSKLLASFEFFSDGTPVHGNDLPNGTNTHPPSSSNHTQAPCVSGNSSIPDCDILPSAQRQPSHPWLWGLIGWSVLAKLLYAILFYALTAIKTSFSIVTASSKRTKQWTSIQCDESSPLLSNTGSVENGGRHLKEGETQGKTEDGVKELKEMSSLRVMLKLVCYCRPDAHLYIIGFTFLVLAASATAFIPYYTGQVINHIAITPSMKEFKQAILIMAMITVGNAICAGLRGGILVIANSRLQIRIRNKLFQSLVKQEIAFFDKSETGDLTSRLTSDTTKMSDQISLNLNIFLRNVVQFIGSIVFMIQLTWKLTAITLVGIPLITVVTKYYGGFFKQLSKAIQDSFAKANNIAEETLSSMRTVRSFANEKEEARRFAAKLVHTYHVYIKFAFVYGAWMCNNTLLELVLQVVTLYYGGHLVIYGEMTGGELVSLLLYQVSLTAALDAIGSVFTGIMQAIGAAEKVFELIDRVPEINQEGGKSQPTKLQGTVEFKNVWFSYPTRPEVQVLKGITFSAQPGEVVALVGPSGGGKSSCISLLERFYEPDSGEVLLDGQPLSMYDHTYFHNKLSLVGQEPVLYARSMADNISCGMREASKEMVQHSAELANAHGFINGMLKGYDTEAGERGTQLSGGQKQRIAIARALIRNPVVLLLDEATSALDAESEHLVQQALSRNFKGRTVIVIAHRLSTVENADKIVVINKGEVLEVGSHQELLKRNGMYSKLVRKQMVALQKRKMSVEEDEESEHSADSMEDLEQVQVEGSEAISEVDSEGFSELPYTSGGYGATGTSSITITQ